MTAGSGTPGARPEMFRPRMLLIWAGGLSAVIVLGLLLGWWAIGADVRARFTAFQVITLLAIAGGGIAIMMAMALSTVTADPSGLTVRNAVLSRRLSWDEVEDVRWGPGASWAHLILTDNPDDPSRVPMLALQTVDGRRTRAAVDRLRELLAAHRNQPKD
ncbi:PH domain-containing protein [Enemella dayhoffiae]|nr:PH domain-containing protein [Enemella dayhoffiae]